MLFNLKKNYMSYEKNYMSFIFCWICRVINIYMSFNIKRHIDTRLIFRWSCTNSSFKFKVAFGIARSLNFVCSIFPDCCVRIENWASFYNLSSTLKTLLLQSLKTLLLQSLLDLLLRSTRLSLPTPTGSECRTSLLSSGPIVFASSAWKMSLPTAWNDFHPFFSFILLPAQIFGVAVFNSLVSKFTERGLEVSWLLVDLFQRLCCCASVVLGINFATGSHFFYPPS